MPPDKVREAIEERADIVKITSFTTATQLQALRIAEAYRYSYYDSLIIATALENKCSVLYSEDMQHNQQLDGQLTIVNPFL